MADRAALPKPKTRGVASAETRARVLQAARAAFEHLGFEHATIRLIGRSAGLSTGAVFSAFTDKAALYAAVYGHAPISQAEARGLLAEVAELRLQLALATGATRIDDEGYAIRQVDAA